MMRDGPSERKIDEADHPVGDPRPWEPDTPEPGTPYRIRVPMLLGIAVLVSLIGAALFYSYLGRGVEEELLAEFVAGSAAVPDGRPGAADAKFEGSDGRIDIPDARSAILDLYSNPSGAVVQIDYDSVGVTPLVDYSLAAGVYVLSMEHGTETLMDTVIVLLESDAGSRLVLHGRSSPGMGGADHPAELPSGGNDATVVSSRSSPADSRSVRSSGGEGFTSRGAASPDQERSSAGAAAPSEDAAAGGHGTIVVLVRPWGTIYVDGELRERDMDVQYTSHLPAGAHTVTVVHPSLGRREQALRVDAGMIHHLVIDLRNEPPEW